MDDIRLTRDLAAAGFDFTEVEPDAQARRVACAGSGEARTRTGNREMGEPVEQHHT